MNHAVIATLLVLLAGCAANRATPVDFGRIPDEPADPARHRAASAALRSEERCHYKSYREAFKAAGGNGSECSGGELPNYRPELGLSLSGGGMRSASFSIGILEGLSHAGILDDVDIISSVSGGSYANYWYITKLHGAMVNGQALDRRLLFSSFYSLCKEQRGRFDQELCPKYLREGEAGEYEESRPYRVMPESSSPLPKPHRFQFHLETHSYLLTAWQDSNWGWRSDSLIWGLELFGETATWAASIPFNLLGNALFRWQWNVNPFEWYYENGIERTFGLYPTDWFAYSNDAFFGAVNPLFDALARDSRAGTIPFFVINTTAAYGGSIEWARSTKWAGFNSDLASTVYEFTPLSYGNSAFGYCNYADDEKRSNYGVTCYPADVPDLGQVVMMSGAAVDDLKLSNQPTLSAFVDPAADALNLTLGKYIANPRVPASSRILHKFLPFPLYFAVNRRYDETRDSVYLSDGGHSENLGLYALIRRGVKNIIAVDAEHEPASAGKGTLAIFDALQRLRCHVWKEDGLVFRAIAGDSSLPDVFADYRQGGCVAHSRDHVKWDFAHRDPYIRFQICPVKGACTADVVQNVLYIKLSVNSDALPDQTGVGLRGCDLAHNFSCEAVWAYRRGPTDCTGIYGSTVATLMGCNQFPQDSTGDIAYPRIQFNGYRTLGFDIARRIREGQDGFVADGFVRKLIQP